MRGYNPLNPSSSAKDHVFSYGHHQANLHDLQAEKGSDRGNSSMMNNARRLIGNRQRHMKEPVSLNNEFNKKMLEKGGATSNVAPNELPPAAALYM